MPKLRHLAVVAMNPEEMARFYCEVFEMTIIDRTPTGAVSLSDGTFNLTFLPQRAEGKPCGLNHFGFVVEDADEIARRLAAHAVVGPTDRPEDRAYAEQRATDPEGNNFDISEHGYDRPETVEQRKERKTAPA
jgi:catechol 2,3-dioxygenase-like lactoylglutathione lyase family enzyme